MEIENIKKNTPFGFAGLRITNAHDELSKMISM